jgi:Rha family phage regulatory protein
MHISKFTPEQLIASLVSEYNKQPVTTSLIVAEYFGKRHDHVLRAVDAMREDCGEDYHRLNFGEMKHSVIIGKGATREDRSVRMTKDGFTLLAMGFTGKKAMQFKMNYILAFNNMEAILKKRDQWEPIRSLGKGMRRDLTDAIAEFIEYAQARGAGKGANHYYSNFTKLEYKLLFLVANEMPKGFRNLLDVESLETLAYTEKALARHIRREMGNGMAYKDIYVSAKNIAQMSIDILGGRRMLPDCLAIAA